MNKTLTELHTTPLYSVCATSLSNIEYTWNFIQEGESFIFAGKTLIHKKKNAKNHHHLITQKPQFTIESSRPLPLSEYTYIPNNLISSAHVNVFNCSRKPEKKTFEWFANIAPLLLAIENKDSLLAAEIFHKNASSFMKYPTTTIKLIESIAVEALFSWIWGRFDEKAMSDLQIIYSGKCTKHLETWGVVEALFTSARRRLDIQGQKETIDDCMARYLKTHAGTKLTLGIVGTNHYRWVEKKLYSQQEQKKKHDFNTTKSFLQADVDNRFDKNAIALYIQENEGQESQKKITGYIRKTGAEILRKALPTKLHFSSKLARLGYVKGGATGIVVEITV